MALESPSYYDEKNAKAMESIEELTKNVDSVQKRVLAEILSQNANTEYLQRFKLNGATDRDSFKSKVPVITYEDIKPDIQRVANGDKSPIFSSQPISEFLVRYYQSQEGQLSRASLYLRSNISIEYYHKRGYFGNLLQAQCFNIVKHSTSQAYYSAFVARIFRNTSDDKFDTSYIPGLDKGKCLDFFSTKVGSRTPGGILARGALSSKYRNPHYNSTPYNPYLVFTSPTETIFCSDYFQSMYSQMLCGLLMRVEIVRLGASFAFNLLRAIRFLQLNWKQLCQDIETGTLSPTAVTDPSVRDCMSRILCKPNPELAEFIKKECESEKWERIIPRIWPHTKYLKCIVTGTMARYIPSLDYYSGGLPIVCTNYSSSECPLGINLKPLSKPFEVSYTIMPNMGYFEFIHHNNDLANSNPSITSEYRPCLVDLANLEIGEEYEIVITTYAGLCRYRMGDILQVTGFHNAAPQLKYLRRKDVVLSIDSDKTTEVELQNGIDNASALLRPYNVDVVEFTSYADIKTIPGHYVIYCELLAKDPCKALSHDVLTKCCLAIEESLNWLYRQKRGVENIIGPLEIRVVKNGTFEELMEYAISRGVSIDQYKVSRCVSFTPIIKLLDSKVVSTHFSPAEPHQCPDIPPTLTGSTTSDFHSIT